MASPALQPECLPEIVSRPSLPRPSELPTFFRRIAAYDREFVMYDDGWRGWTYTYSEIARMAGAFAARLRTHGIRKGETVMVWSESRPGWMAALWGGLVEGIALVPVEPQASVALFQRIAQKVKPRLLLMGDLVPALEPSETGSVPVWRMRDLEVCLETAGGAPAREPVSLTVDDIAEIVFTSGTTGEPKGVVMTHGNLAANLKPVEEQIAPYRKYLRLFSPLRALNLLPMSHLFGQAAALFVPPVVPASVVFMTGAGGEEIVRQIRMRRICVLVSVPRVLEVLRNYILRRFPDAANATDAPWPLQWWRNRAVHKLFGWRFCCVIAGGAPLPADLEQFWSNLGFVVVQGYGLTETAPIISFTHPFHVKSGTAGKPVAGLEVKIDPSGEVLVRGPSVTPGYFQAPAQTAAAFQNGWFRTGDIGELDSEGDLTIRGRIKDMIATPEGLKVFPEDVETVLNRIQGVRDCAVTGRDRVHAVLVLEPGVRGEDVVREANERLEAHQKIRSFSLWTHGDLPRTSTTRKLRRAEIARVLETGASQPLSRPETTLAALVQKYAPGRTITPETTLDELGISSLDRVELLMDLEEKLGASIDESRFASVSKVADLAQPMAALRETPQPRWNRKWPSRLARRLLLPTTLLPVTRFFARRRVTGLENLRSLKGPVIFAANHQSHFDTPSILASLPARWRYRIAPAMWKEYFDAHFFPERFSRRESWKTRLWYYLVTLFFNAFPIPQTEAGTRQSVRYLGELVEEGWSILIFPEGERTLTGEIGRFFPGVGLIASRMRLPVVPIRLTGFDRVLHRMATWPRPGPVEIKFGAPLFLKGDSYTALTKQVEDAVRKLQ